ncbi:unnamed protein product, partial [Prorocentrum cordatum]
PPSGAWPGSLAGFADELLEALPREVHSDTERSEIWQSPAYADPADDHPERAACFVEAHSDTERSETWQSPADPADAHVQRAAGSAE